MIGCVQGCCAAVAVSSLCAAPAPTTQPAPLIVPDRYATIQQAIDAARPGQTVLVKPGEYREAVTLKGAVHLKGTNRDTCVLRPADGACAILTAIDCKDTVIEDLTLDGVGRRVATDLRGRAGFQLEVEHGVDERHPVVHASRANPPPVPPR